jgi:hypothetical protein
MTKQSKFWVVVATVVVLGGFLTLNSVYHFTGGYGRVVDGLITRNVAARGGAEAWGALDSLRLAGQMDLGQGLHVPYVMEQKRPGKMCLEFVFDEETAIQCVSGADTGWKLLPFRGSKKPEPMNKSELAQLLDAADIDGLLLNAAESGNKIKFMGKETVAGRIANKLQVTLPGGALRWLYVDDETGLEIKLESTRVLRGEERVVETFYSDWRDEQGLLISHRQDTQIEGDKESHFITVDKVTVNPPLDDARFMMPTGTTNSGAGNTQ